MKDIKDYLHLYLGCDVKHEALKNIRPLTPAWYGALQKENILYLLKPILRPLSDMTEEEAIGLAKIQKYDIPEDDGVREELINIYTYDDEELTLGNYLPVKYYLDGLLYLLKQSFDLFNLIPEGLAIDKTKTPQP